MKSFTVFDIFVTFFAFLSLPLMWEVHEARTQVEEMKNAPEQSCYRLERLNDTTVVFKVDTIIRTDFSNLGR